MAKKSNVKHVTNRMGTTLSEEARKANVPREGWDRVLTPKRKQELFTEMIEASGPNTLSKVFERLTSICEKTHPGKSRVNVDILNMVDHRIVNLEDTSPFQGKLIERKTVARISSKQILNILKEQDCLIELSYVQGLLEIEKRIRDGYFTKNFITLIVPISTKLKSGRDCFLVAHNYIFNETLSVDVLEPKHCTFMDSTNGGLYDEGTLILARA